jgi:hypothetical protein
VWPCGQCQYQMEVGIASSEAQLLHFMEVGRLARDITESLLCSAKSHSCVEMAEMYVGGVEEEVEEVDGAVVGIEVLLVEMLTALMEKETIRQVGEGVQTENNAQAWTSVLSCETCSVVTDLLA